MTADCTGSQLALYANGQRLAQVEDEDFTSGQAGVYALTHVAGLDLQFSRLEIRQAG